MATQQSFWQWLMFLIIGLAILSMVPDNVKPYLIATVLLGSLLFINGTVSGGKGLQFLYGELTGQIGTPSPALTSISLDQILAA